MRPVWAILVLMSPTCFAQSAGQPLDEWKAAAEAAMRGNVERVPIPWRTGQLSYTTKRIEIEAPDAVEPPPTGESISVAGLQHKIPAAARRSFARANKLSQSGNHRGAATEFEVAIRHDPGFALAFNLLGTEYARIGRFDESLAALGRSLELDPNSWSAYYNRGLVLFQLGDQRGAETSMRRSLEVAAERPQTHWMLGYLLCQRETTRDEGLRHVQYAARTIKEAKRFLASLQIP